MKRIVIVAAALALLAGCATAPTSTPGADPNYVELLKSAREIQSAQANAQTAFGLAAQEKAQQLPTSLQACAAMKSEAVQVLCVLGVNGNLGGQAIAAAAPQTSVNLPGPPPEKPSVAGQLWTAFLQVSDRALQVWGIREGRRERVDLAHINAGVSMAQIGGMVQLGTAGISGTAAGYQYVQAPGAVTTTTNTNTLSGTGVLGSGTYTYSAPVTTTTRTCSGGGAGSGGGDPPAGGGAGGPASC